MRRTTRDARRRALAQNFLVTDEAIATVVSAVSLHPARDTVVDLGAGRGALTRALAQRAARVVAVERDPEWARQLRSREWENVEVVEGDARTVSFPPPPYAVVASLPFNVGTALVRRLLAEGHGMTEAALVLQLEAARRLAHGGLFAATWAPWFDLRVVARLPASAFRPVPSVDAGVLRMRARRPALLSPAAFATHAALVDAVFAAPGRTVRDRLRRNHGPREAARLLAAAELAPGTRLREVGPEAWATLTRAAAATPRGRAPRCARPRVR